MALPHNFTWNMGVCVFLHFSSNMMTDVVISVILVEVCWVHQVSDFIQNSKVSLSHSKHDIWNQVIQPDPSITLFWLTDWHQFNGLFFQDNLGNLDFKKQEIMGWQWHQLDHMQIICTSLQTDNYASTSSLNFLQARCSSWCQTNSFKALKATVYTVWMQTNVST